MGELFKFVVVWVWGVSWLRRVFCGVLGGMIGFKDFGFLIFLDLIILVFFWFNFGGVVGLDILGGLVV